MFMSLKVVAGASTVVEIPFYDHSHKMLSYKGNNVTFPQFLSYISVSVVQ